MGISIKKWKDEKDEFEVIKWTYDKSQGRSIPKKAGNIKITYSFLPPKVLEILDEDEKKELLAFWNTTKEGREKERLQRLHVPVKHMCDDVKQALLKDMLNEENIEKISEEIDALKKEISKAKRKITIAKKGEKNG